MLNEVIYWDNWYGKAALTAGHLSKVDVTRNGARELTKQKY